MGLKQTLEPAAGGEQTTLEDDVVLVSAGRVPFTAGLQLEKIGVETDKAGRILVNEPFPLSRLLINQSVRTIS